MPIPNLRNGNDCGFFALVFTSNFTEGIDPSGWQHEEKTLKSCLLQFLETNKSVSDTSVKSKLSKFF